jgi:FKBP-type peptidyl-prolyl cis-trans isomerase FklB
MKTIKIWSLLCVILLVSGCKQNNWLDWKTQNELFLMQNAQREGIITTPTGLQYECIFPGHATSARPDNAKMVEIKYQGELINGYQFDSKDSYIGYVNQFVPGFCEGLKKMNEFGIFKFYIPYDLGYGNQGKGTEGTASHIPPYSTLIFYVELKDVI